jgi:glyoxylase-like metal-dependent hydrolase (beta-lactamase superfamily II)
VCWVEYARGTLGGGTVVAHGALRGHVDSTQSGVVLRSPKGTWLVDGGMSTGFATELHEVHGFARFLLSKASKGWTRTATSAEALRAVGVDPATLAGVIPTHGHFDHLGGLLELPNVPVLLPQAEIDLAAAATRGEASSVLPAEGRALIPRASALSFEPVPLRMWPESHDLFGDGSVVLVPMAGHTPGSVGVWIHLPDARNVLLVGDAVWVREGYEHREPKGWLASSFDADRADTDLQIARLSALHAAEPELAILPAHDRRAWVDTFGTPGCVSAPGAPTPPE